MISNAVLYNNPLDEFPDFEVNSQALKLCEEQQKDQDIRTVIRWKTGLGVPNVKYAPQSLRKYFNHLNRLVIEDDVLYREFFDDTGRVHFKQYFVSFIKNCLTYQQLKRISKQHLTPPLKLVSTLKSFRRTFTN